MFNLPGAPQRARDGSFVKCTAQTSVITYVCSRLGKAACSSYGVK